MKRRRVTLAAAMSVPFLRDISAGPSYGLLLSMGSASNGFRTRFRKCGIAVLIGSVLLDGRRGLK
jgi:hypothetical protein